MATYTLAPSCYPQPPSAGSFVWDNFDGHDRAFRQPQPHRLSQSAHFSNCSPTRQRRQVCPLFDVDFACQPTVVDELHGHRDPTAVDARLGIDDVADRLIDEQQHIDLGFRR
jgi:hypothetical protein